MFLHIYPPILFYFTGKWAPIWILEMATHKIKTASAMKESLEADFAEEGVDRTWGKTRTRARMMHVQMPLVTMTCPLGIPYPDSHVNQNSRTR